MPSGSSSRSSSRGSRSRDSSSRRSRSGNRSRSRHRDRESRSHSRHRGRSRFKHKERNFAAAVCSMISIVVLCVAMAETNWISVRGGGCARLHRKPGELHSLGVFQFFYGGKFISSGGHNMPNHDILYKYGTGTMDIMVNCVTYKAALLFKTVIAFCFLGVCCSLGSFLLDLTGPTHRAFKLLHRNAILSIVTVIICVVINLFCFWITVLVEQLQKSTKKHHGSKVEVTFDVSFYLITAAGSVSVFAVACNCLRRYQVSEENTSQLSHDDYDDLEVLLSPSEPDASQMLNLPPPPAYTPTPTSVPTSAVPTSTSTSMPTSATS